MRQFTIKADDDVVCLVLGRDTLNRLIGDNIYEVTFKNIIRFAFSKNSVINKMPKEIQESIVDSMKITSYKPQESIYRRGVVGFQKLTVVVEGSLKKSKDGTVVATKGQCYG
jgi:cGMP-dependent protein kinase 1